MFDDSGGLGAPAGAAGVGVYERGAGTYGMAAAWHDDGVQIMGVPAP